MGDDLTEIEQRGSPLSILEPLKKFETPRVIEEKNVRKKELNEMP